MSPFEGQTFLFMWIGFLLLMIGCIGAFFLWGIRHGQFADQDRARYLALHSGIRPVDKHADKPGSRQENRRRRP